VIPCWPTGGLGIKHIMIALGTRPEVIKMAPLIHALREMPNAFELTICVSGQHRQMLDQALRIFQIQPDIDLDLMKHGQDLTDVASSVLISMKEVLKEYQPDLLLVHGDTTTALAAAMAAFYLSIPVGHVEAGLRTFDLQRPFPEEFNRQVIAKIATIHFAPTQLCKDNLLSEGIKASSIHVTGNTVIDALFSTLDRIKINPDLESSVFKSIEKNLGFNCQEKDFVLITGHRRENFGEGFREICLSLQILSAKYPEMQFVYPVHLNPNVQAPVSKMLGLIPNLHLIDPQDYLQFICLLDSCLFVLTDSGGIQEEAPSLGKPVLVMRETTERPEAVTAGTVELVGANSDKIVSSASNLIDNVGHYNKMSSAHNPYGDGKAVPRIVAALSSGQFAPS
jgi:UDP-N-acetylglucosamine 2-epimerase (non-hydrolysing)